MINDAKSPRRPSQPTSKRSSNTVPTKYSEPDPAQRLRDLLLRANLSQRAAARELGVDERTVRYWAAGQTIPPRMAFLALERLIDLGRQVTDSDLSK
jgi:DNA-binding transcriptional regulator YiaG